MKKNDTLILVLLGLVCAFLLYMFSKKTETEAPLGIVGASTVSENGSASGILTPVTAISAVGTGLSAVESLLSNENPDSSGDYGVGEGDLSDLDIADDTSFDDED
jgi:hypothetical protein